jgi:hypothetical protein
MLTTTLFVLWLYLATTKGMEWHPNRAWETSAECENYSSIALQIGDGGKGPAKDWKCIEYTLHPTSWKRRHGPRSKVLHQQ